MLEAGLAGRGHPRGTGGPPPPALVEAAGRGLTAELRHRRRGPTGTLAVAPSLTTTINLFLSSISGLPTVMELTGAAVDTGRQASRKQPAP